MTAMHWAVRDGVLADERLAEIGAILARGLIRLERRKSSKRAAPNGESSLDFVAIQSGYDNSETGRNGR